MDSPNALALPTRTPNRQPNPRLNPRQLDPRQPTPQLNPRHVLTRLQREWDQLAVSPAALATARRWPIADLGGLASLDVLLRRAGYGRVEKGSHGDDAMLRVLVRLARNDQLAARVVLQRLLPGVRTMAARHAASYADDVGAMDEALCATWTVIRLYPVERRGRYVAANMLRDIEYHAFRRAHRRMARFIPTQSATFERTLAVDDEPSARSELRELLDDARRAGLDGKDLALAERLAAGATPAQLAVEGKVTTRTIRNHRAAVVYRLRQVAAAQACA